MVRVYGPLFSIDASGTIAKSVTFSKWKGRNYGRKRVIPANPRSGPQVSVRAMGRFLSQEWAGLSAANKATWDTRAKQSLISPFNAYCSYNWDRWSHFKTPSMADPAAETSTPAGAPTTTVTAGVKELQLSIADGAPAPDWGYQIFRSLTTSFTPGFSNHVHTIPKTATPTVFIDTGLDTGVTYYYRVRGINDDGVPGALEAETSGTPN